MNKSTKQQFEDWKKDTYDRIFREAVKAGEERAMKCIPTPMCVISESMGQDGKPIGKEYVIEEGICGFAWVTVYPAYCGFAKYLKAYHEADNAYSGGGVQWWVSKYGQSMELKEAFANGFTSVLKGYGIRCAAQSRMD